MLLPTPSKSEMLLSPYSTVSNVGSIQLTCVLRITLILYNKTLTEMKAFGDNLPFLIVSEYDQEIP